MARRRWLTALALGMAAGALVVLAAVWVSPDQTNLAVYGAFVVAVVTLAVPAVRGVWDRRVKTRRGVPGRELDPIVDLLAAAVREQWDSVAGVPGLLEPELIQVRWRQPPPSRSLAVPVQAAVALRRPGPLPGLVVTREAGLQEGDAEDLFAVVGGLGSGRLVVAGEPGSGKTGAAVQLVLAALRYREKAADRDRPAIPVPVLVTAQDWDLASQTARDWLIRRVQQIYPMFAGKDGEADASALISAGKIMVIVDGLDEIAGDQRADALKKLSRLGGKVRLVVLGRTREMASAVEQGGLLEGAAAVELQAVDPQTAANYLTSVQRDPPPGGWRELTARVRVPGSPLAEALSSPLALTLVRDTYRAGDDARELLDFCDTARQQADSATLAGEITGYLLDRVLPAAYPRRPGKEPPGYDLETARNALTKIAARMDQDGTYDLQWWRLPGWVPAAPRTIVFVLVVGLMAWPGWFVIVSANMSAPRLVAGLPLWIMAWLVVGFMFLRVIGPRIGSPQRVGRIRLKKGLKVENARFGLMFGLATGLVMGLAAGFSAGLAGGLTRGFAFGLVNGLAFGFLIGLMAGFTAILRDALEDGESVGALSPLASWRSDHRFGLVVGFTAGLTAGLVDGLMEGLIYGPAYGLMAWLTDALINGLFFGLAFGFLTWAATTSKTWVTWLAMAQLALRWHTPVRLMRFLEDARERNVLRTVGPVYQFRHALLQDRLAGHSQSHQPNPGQADLEQAPAGPTTDREDPYIERTHEQPPGEVTERHDPR